MRSIIKIDHVSKRYQLGARENYSMLRDRIMRGLTAPARIAVSLLRDGVKPSSPRPEIWALKDISLEIEPGEVLGVIGRNGAGKSTLLKILSKITEPSAGRVELYGRVGSLLEVGTGFHGELTGRENIFLSGAILGMRRVEIERKFDEIVNFAEVEEFIDTPVKFYSSGMYTRLAFAVAAHLEPEILLVDEVLAVGDIAFQKKCLGKMSDVARHGRTVLFVSHNMPSIESLCSRCLLFRNGVLEADGKVHDLLMRYMTTELQSDADTRLLTDHPGRRVGSRAVMTKVMLSEGQAGPGAALRMGADLRVSVAFNFEAMSFLPALTLTIKNMHGLPIIRADNQQIASVSFEQRRSAGTITCTFENLPLLPGRYVIDLMLSDGIYPVDTVQDAISFEVLPSDVFGTGKLPPVGSAIVYWPARFAISPNQQDNV
jgi:lipopolysaccharide transport system ATP-binding protein